MLVLRFPRRQVSSVSPPHQPGSTPGEKPGAAKIELFSETEHPDRRAAVGSQRGEPDPAAIELLRRVRLSPAFRKAARDSCLRPRSAPGSTLGDPTRAPAARCSKPDRPNPASISMIWTAFVAQALCVIRAMLAGRAHQPEQGATIHRRGRSLSFGDSFGPWNRGSPRTGE